MASATVASSGTAAISRSQSSSTLMETSSALSNDLTIHKPGSDQYQKYQKGLMNYARVEADVK
jgi:hypothetical protein